MVMSQELILELQFTARRFVAASADVIGVKSRIRVLLSTPDADLQLVDRLERQLAEKERLLAQVIEDLRVLVARVPDPERYLGVMEARVIRAYLQRGRA